MVTILNYNDIVPPNTISRCCLMRGCLTLVMLHHGRLYFIAYMCITTYQFSQPSCTGPERRPGTFWVRTALTNWHLWSGRPLALGLFE